jgi:two-component sensor histidine kinase
MNNPGSPEMTLKKTSARISALSIVHQEIYNSDNPLYLSNANFIEIILTNLLNDFQSSNISLDLDFAKVIYVGMDQAILLSLIVNELCTNTINHAYPNGETGILHVKLYNDDSDSIVLEFFDEGVGLPSDVDVGSFDNLGFTIVKSLVGQLNGNVNVMDLDKGFGLFIKF